ncbi:MAG: hypothetical protein KZQ93_05020 [Candidatus Thiodiazotropha sp. (ex Monitilora ramsayi)]|nr:hypothetical protein [Candidatus Thiodiazotropha sp. (ex Monitilora ramsayi)]
MKKITTAIFILVSIIIPLHSFADGPGWTGPSTVERLVVVATGGINVKLSPDLNGCTSQSGYGEHYASIPPNHTGLNLMQSNLLTAFTAGKKVRLYLSDDTCKAMEMMLEE